MDVFVAVAELTSSSMVKVLLNAHCVAIHTQMRLALHVVLTPYSHFLERRRLIHTPNM